MFGYPFRPPGAPRLRPNVRASLPPSLVQPSASAPNEPVVAPAGEGNRRPVHPLYRPSPPPPSAAPRLRLGPGAPAPPPQVPPPHCYAASDPGIFWLNNRPYWVNRLLGKGGFGEVHEVEMLLPRGLEVDWDENGDLKFDKDGCVGLKESKDPAAQESRPLGLHTGAASSSQAEVSLSPMSMTTSESLWFSEVRREQAGGSVSDSGGGLGLSSSGDAPVVGDAVKRSADNHSPAGCSGGYSFVQRSGVFFALKRQSARNEKQLDSLIKEVENMRLLSGEAGIVQLRDHAVDRNSLSLVILMELGACDLHAFLKQRQYSLDVSSIVRVWSILVHRIETLHKFDVIHRDIKPQNFVLVPTDGHRGAGILARTSTPRKDFVFRLVEFDVERPTRKQDGDVELVLKDQRGKEEVLLLSIKLTDFGIARNLDPDAAHVSLPGPNGTVVFMAPEAVRQTVSRSRKVSKRVDIWALGVVLYQMLHAGKTPFGDYLVSGGPPEALLAVASETVNREAMKFDASDVWTVERTRILSSETHSSQDLPTMTAEVVKALVVSWVGSELLVRVCKRCLVFDVDDRVDGTDLRILIDEAIETGWGLSGIGGAVSQSELLLAAFNIDANGMMQTVDMEVARIGERIGASLFPEIWVVPVPSSQDPRRSLVPSHTKERVMLGGSSGTSSNSTNRKGFVDLEAPRSDHSRDDIDGPVSESRVRYRERRREGRFRHLWILVCVVAVGFCSGLVVMMLIRNGGTKNNDDLSQSPGIPSSPESGYPSTEVVTRPSSSAPHDPTPRNPDPVAPHNPAPRDPVAPHDHVAPRDPVASHGPASRDPVPHDPAPRVPALHASASAPSSTSPLSLSGPPVSQLSSSSPPSSGTAPRTGTAAGTEIEKQKEAVLSKLSRLALDTQEKQRALSVFLNPKNENLRADKDVVLQAVAKNGRALMHAHYELQADREVVSEAVANLGQAIMYASYELRADRGFVLAAVVANESVLEYAPPSFRLDRGFVLEAIAKNAQAFYHAEGYLQHAREFVLAAVAANEEVLEYAPWVFWSDEGFLLEAIAKNALAFVYAPPEFQDDREFVLAAVAENGLVLEYVSDHFRADWEIVSKAVAQNHTAIPVPIQNLPSGEPSDAAPREPVPCDFASCVPAPALHASALAPSTSPLSLSATHPASSFPVPQPSSSPPSSSAPRTGTAAVSEEQKEAVLEAYLLQRVGADSGFVL